MELRIEIRPGSDPICGTVAWGDPPRPRSFVGWMGLVELISGAVAEAGDPSAAPGPDC